MQGDDEELDILLQKCLISSRFNQKLSLRKREHQFIKILSQKIYAVQFAEGALDGHNDEKSVGHDPTTWIPLLLDLGHPIFIGVSLCSHLSLYYLLSV